MKIAVIVLCVAVMLSFATYFFVREVMVVRPAVCRYCHFITPYYNKWERSTHNMVPCLKCHEYGPLNALSGQLRFIVGTYNPRPLTNVPDAKCLQSGCHERRLIESTVTIGKHGIVFDHKPHFMMERTGMRLHCRSCHSDIVQGEHMKVSMNVCFLCHIGTRTVPEALQGCSACHTEPPPMVTYRGVLLPHFRSESKARSCQVCHTSVKAGDGHVPRERCFFCHVDRTERYSDTVFVHRQHVEKKQIDCFFCHEFVEHGNIKLATDIDRMMR
jgi:hypothetical protein